MSGTEILQTQNESIEPNRLWSFVNSLISWWSLRWLFMSVLKGIQNCVLGYVLKEQVSTWPVVPISIWAKSSFKSLLPSSYLESYRQAKITDCYLSPPLVSRAHSHHSPLIFYLLVGTLNSGFQRPRVPTSQQLRLEMMSWYAAKKLRNI